MVMSSIHRKHVFEVQLLTNRIRGLYKTPEEECSTLLSKNLGYLEEELKKLDLEQTKKDRYKDLENDTTTEFGYSKTINSCLRELDYSEKMNCNISCQKSIQNYRKLNTKRACIDNWKNSIWDARGRLKKRSLGKMHHLFPIENSKLIFCYIPKSGCTTWKRILLTAAGHIDSPSSETDDIHSLFRRKIKPLSQYRVRGAERRLKTYTKFLFVRESLQRLLSLFLDKAVNEGRLPFNETQFEDFLKFITERPLIPRGFEEHWAEANYLCMPCDISYDFIGRIETSKRDTQYVFDNFLHENRDRLMVYHEPNHQTNSSSSDKKKRYFSQVSDNVMWKAINRYHLDYVLFNYDKPFDNRTV